MNYKKIVRWSGIYDLVLTAPFALPYTAKVNLEIFGDVHEYMGLDGVWDDRFSNTSLLFVLLMGMIVSVWSILRILHPKPLLGLFDGMARFCFSFCFIYYVYNGGSHIMLIFLVPEIIWGLVQVIFFYFPAKQAHWS